MADGVFNYAKGRFVEKIADATTANIVLLMQANEAEATLIDRTDLADVFIEAGNTEATFTNYARKTGIDLSASITVDTTNDRVDVNLADQTWTSAGGATNNTLTKLVVAIEESAADSGRIPMTHHDFAVTTDGSDITAQVHIDGFGRAA